MDLSTNRYVISNVKSGNNQATEISKFGIGSGNAWSRASRFLLGRNDNKQNFKALLDKRHCYTWIDPIQAETEDVRCQQIDHNSRKFQLR